MELNMLLRLLMAHFIGDFLLQPTSWVKAKEDKGVKAKEFYYHIAVITALTFLFLANLAQWYIPVIIMITHGLIDAWKSYRPATTLYFLLDQFFHVAVIFLVWSAVSFDCSSITKTFAHYFTSVHFWTILLAYYLVTGPLGIAIGVATGKWQKDAGMDTGGLARAGMWIGRCERVLVLTFILLNQYTALGFLMTAKSILRFGDKEDREQKKTEYILVGTLISFAAAAVVGTIARYVLGHW